MKFNTPRQIISQKLIDLSIEKLRKHKIYVPRVKKSHLAEISSVSQNIKKQWLPSNLVRKKLKGKLGYGIFLHPKAKPILKGQVIAPYAGEVTLCPKESENDSDYIFGLVTGLLLTREEQKIFDPENRYHPRRIYSLDLDAEKKGNFTRFINHSQKPNVEAELFRTSNGCEIVYIAKKTIRPGEQLLVCYEGKDKSYWGALKIKPFPMTPQTFRLNASLKLVAQ